MRDNRYLRDRMRDTHYKAKNRYLERSKYYPIYREDYSDYRDSRDNYLQDFRDYRGDYDATINEYRQDLKEWTEELKKHDKFKTNREEILSKAKHYGVHFDEYSEDEFLASYYLMMAIFKDTVSELSTCVLMTKRWLEENTYVSPSEKLSIYLYKIHRGE